MLQHPLDNTIVGIGALVIALEALPAFIPRDSERNAVLGPQFLQLGHDTGCDDGRGFCVQQVHERLVELEFAVDRVREEVGVYEDRVWGPEGGVGLEKERGGYLGAGEWIRSGGVVGGMGWDGMGRDGTGRDSEAYISRLADSSCFFLAASISPAI